MTPSIRLAVVIIIALLVPVVPFLIIGELPGERWLSSTDESAFIFGLSGAGLLASDILLPIPSSVVGTFLGARLGFTPGWVWIWVGLMLGNSIGYITGRYLLASVKVTVSEDPTLAVLFISRPVPVLAEAVAITAGAAKTSVRHFLITCAVGNAIYSSLLSANGAFLIPKSLVGPGLVLPMALPAVTWLIWRWQVRRRKTLEE